MTQIFISYSRKDINFIKQLADDLKSYGFDVWYDLSQLGGGARWYKAIEQAIKDSQCVIVVLSPDSIKSDWVGDEVVFARKEEKKIIPLYYRPCEVGMFYVNLNYIDVQGENYYANFNMIFNEIKSPSMLQEMSDEKDIDFISNKIDDFPTRNSRMLPEQTNQEIYDVGIWFESLEDKQNIQGEIEDQDADDWLRSLDESNNEQPVNASKNTNTNVPDWLQRTETPKKPDQEQDDAVKWLESLAAKQDAKPEKYIPDSKKLDQEPPDWLMQDNQKVNADQDQPDWLRGLETNPEKGGADLWIEALAANESAEDKEKTRLDDEVLPSSNKGGSRSTSRIARKIFEPFFNKNRDVSRVKENKQLKVFLCHSSEDKSTVRELYQKLSAEKWIKPWLDDQSLTPDSDLDFEIREAMKASDVIIICLSKSSIRREGYMQKEVQMALDLAAEKSSSTIIIPLRLEECNPPHRLRELRYVDYFPASQQERAFQRLLISLKKHAASLDIQIDSISAPTQNSDIPNRNKLILSNGMEFICIPAGKFLMGSENSLDSEKPQHTVDIPYNYWLARFPVTNELYNAYIKSNGSKHPVEEWEKKKDHPVVNISWRDAMEYCQWLNKLFKAELPAGLILRLPSEPEWEKGARGTDGRDYPWGNTFDKNKCNSYEGGKSRGTTSVGLYSPQGDSPYGCSDMAGNVSNFTHSQYKPYPYNSEDGRENEQTDITRVERGGSFSIGGSMLSCAFRIPCPPGERWGTRGFRVVASLPLPK